MATSTSKSSGTSGAGATSSKGNGSSGGVSGAYESTTQAVSDASRYTGRKITQNPVGALVGGFAVGAVIGACIPATRRERDALRPLGGKVSDAARTAAREAAVAGRDKLNKVTGEVVTQVGSKVVDAVAPPKES